MTDRKKALQPLLRNFIEKIVVVGRDSRIAPMEPRVLRPSR